jgi:hypothetical protein
MTARHTFDQALAAFLEEGPTMAPSDLLDTVQGRLPERRGARRPPGGISRFPMVMRLSRTAVAITAIIAVGAGGIWLFGGGGPAPAGPGATSTAEASPTGSAPPASVAPTPATSAAAPSDRPAIAPCDPAQLVARITGWSGATGHRIADVVLTNTGSVACELPALEQVQLIDGNGATIIDGAQVTASETLTIDAGAVLATMVNDSNYCGATPAAPVTVAFILPGDAGRIVAVPVSATDVEGVPPCSGQAGSPTRIEMHPWAP